MLHLTLNRVPSFDPSSNSPSSSAFEPSYKTQLAIKGRAFDVQQFESGVKRKFSKLCDQTLAGEVFGPGLEQLYETISAMANAFVERTEGGNVSRYILSLQALMWMWLTNGLVFSFT
jgi:hypothetical protein